MGAPIATNPNIFAQIDAQSADSSPSAQPVATPAPAPNIFDHLDTQYAANLAAQAAAARRQDVPLGQVLPRAVESIPQDAGRFTAGLIRAGEGATYPIRHPILATQAAGNAIARGALTPGSLENDAGHVLNGIYNYAHNRYGLGTNPHTAYEDIKRAIANHPVETAADIATIAAPIGGIAGKGADVADAAGLARTAGAARKVDGISGGVAHWFNPLTYGPAPAAKLIGKGAQAAWDLTDPKGSIYLNVLGDRGAAVRNELAHPGPNQGVIVPGSLPTGPEAAVGADARSFSALQDTVQDALQKANSPQATALKDKFGDRFDQQNAARVAAINSFAGQPSDIARAVTARKAITEPILADMHAQTVTSDPELEAILNTPGGARALAMARETSLNRMEGRFQTGVTAPEVVDEETGETTPATWAEYPGQSIHGVQKALGSMIKDPEQHKFDAEQKNAFIGLRQKLTEWADQNVPGFTDYRQTYADLSRPIDQMKVAQGIVSKLKPALGEGTAAQRATAYAEILKNAPSIIKSSTGEQRYSELGQLFDPHHLGVFDAVRDDLARKAQLEQASRFASGAGDMQPGGAAARKLKVNLFHPAATVANHVLGLLGGHLDSPLPLEMGNELLTPNASLKAIDNAMARAAKGRRIGAPIGNAARALYSVPSVYNALGNQGSPNKLARK